MEFYLLQEDGDLLLQEDGDFIILDAVTVPEGGARKRRFAEIRWPPEPEKQAALEEALAPPEPVLEPEVREALTERPEVRPVEAAREPVSVAAIAGLVEAARVAALRAAEEDDEEEAIAMLLAML